MWEASPSTWSSARHVRRGRVAEPAEPARGADRQTDDGSRTQGGRTLDFRAALRNAGPVWIAISAAGALAGLLLVATEFLTIASVDVASGSCEVINDANPALADRCRLSGFERHGGAFLLLGLLALLMAYGAGLGRSVLAAIALIAIGAIVLVWALALDLPETDKTGAIGRNFEGASGQRGPGLYVEIVGGLAAILAGGARLLRLRGD